MSNIFGVCIGLLDVQRNDVEFVEVLQPTQVVIAFDETKLAEFAQAAKRDVVLMEVQEATMAFFTGKKSISLIEYDLQALSEEHLALKILLRCHLLRCVIPSVIIL